MELHFCSQCGISIPLVEVQSGAAVASDGRMLCAEHRPASAGGRSGGSGDADVELLFCANCRVSIPVVDVDSGRARKEFGSLLCALCTEADPGERSARRKAVEAEMAVDAAASDPVALRHCGKCGASVPQGHIVTGRARVEGDRVVCERCRETAPAPTSGVGAGTLVLVVLLLVAVGAAGYFGTEYVKSRSDSAAGTETAKAIEALRIAVDSRLDLLEKASRDGDADASATLDEALAQFRDQVSGDLVALRTDLAEVRSELQAADGDLAQRVAQLEGRISNMQEVVRGLVERPSVEVRTSDPPPGPPEGPPSPPPGEDGGPRPTDGPVVAQPDPAVTRLLKDLLESADPGTRFNAGLELIRLKAVVAVPAFARALSEDENILVRRVAARGLGTLRAWYAVPVLIQALEDRESYVAQQANFALQTITGQDFGVNIDQSPRERKTKAAAAMKWWEKNKDAPPEGVCLEAVDLPKK